MKNLVLGIGLLALVVSASAMVSNPGWADKNGILRAWGMGTAHLEGNGMVGVESTVGEEISVKVMGTPTNVTGDWASTDNGDGSLTYNGSGRMTVTGDQITVDVDTGVYNAKLYASGYGSNVWLMGNAPGWYKARNTA